MKRYRNRIPRVNGDTMTTIVLFALFFCTAVVIWGMLQASEGIDSWANTRGSLNSPS